MKSSLIDKKYIKKKNIFIISLKFNDSSHSLPGSIKPAGCCYILLDQAASKTKPDFQLEILEMGLHMHKTNVQSLRQQLKEGHTLIFSSKDFLSMVPSKIINQVCRPADKAVPLVVGLWTNR